MSLPFESNDLLKSYDGSSFMQPKTFKPFKKNDFQKLDKSDFIPRGSCSSYVLSCCDKNSISVDMSEFNFISSFDEKTGILSAQSGILISSILIFYGVCVFY